MDIEKEIKKAMKYPHQEINLDLSNEEYARYINDKELKEKIMYLSIQKYEIEKELKNLIFKYKKGDKSKCFKRSKI